MSVCTTIGCGESCKAHEAKGARKERARIRRELWGAHDDLMMARNNLPANIVGVLVLDSVLRAIDAATRTPKRRK